MCNNLFYLPAPLKLDNQEEERRPLGFKLVEIQNENTEEDADVCNVMIEKGWKGGWERGAGIYGYIIVLI